MKRLYLLRHAHALAEAPPGGGDHDRPLSGAGTAEAMDVARHLLESRDAPGVILSSSSARTLETARIVAKGADIRAEKNLYLAPAAALAERVRAVEDACRRLMLVGHNPGIGELAAYLSDGRVDAFPPAALATFDLDADAWRDFDLE